MNTMAIATGRACTEFPCPNLQPCPIHRQRRPFEGATRRDAPYSTSRWKRERTAFLLEHQNCRDCGGKSTTVDHARQGADFWDKSAWVALCKRCHDSRSGRTARSRRWK